MKFRDMTIRKKLTLLLMSAGAGAVLLACMVFYIMTTNQFRKAYEDSISTLAAILGHNCQASLAFRIPDEADKVLKSLSVSPSVIYAAVLDPAGNVFSSYGKDPRHPDTGKESGGLAYLRISHNIVVGGNVIGSVVLFDDMRELRKARLNAVSVLFFAVLISLGAAFAIVSILQGLISKPILSLALTARNIARQQDFSLRAEKLGNDEVGQFVDAFNAMLVQIENSNTERQKANEERHKLETQLQQSQKMEAIGQLAGGIAHDFNNMLTAIIGYGSLLNTRLGNDSELKPFVDQILSSAGKSADLTRQLLAFSRKQLISPRKTDLDELIRGTQKLLMRLIGEDIELKTQLADKALIVMVDPGQIEQVLMNLATNARDAMPDGGLLSICTDTEKLSESYVKEHDMEKPGMYALISVTDTGIGIDGQTQQKIFEPFFTTKEMGKGTGLGLSIVYGIIKQHGGNITVYSEPGKGTIFRIYLPLIGSKIEEAELTLVITPKGGTETILLAEDNEDVRVLSKHVLEEHGYRVIAAVDGEDAIDKFKDNKDRIEFIIIDVIMPKKSGKEAIDEIKKINPHIKVLFTSGYTSEIISRKGVLEEGINFMSKPATPHNMLAKIREILDKET